MPEVGAENNSGGKDDAHFRLQNISKTGEDSRGLETARRLHQLLPISHFHRNCHRPCVTR